MRASKEPYYSHAIRPERTIAKQNQSSDQRGLVKNIGRQSGPIWINE